MASASIAYDVAQILDGAGLGSFASGTGWAINVGSEPTSPDTAITVYDTGGTEPNPKFLLDYPTFRIRVRANRKDYLAGYNKIAEIKDALLGLPSQDFNGTRYVGIWATSDILHLGESEDRPIFTITWRSIREPASGDNRIEL